MGRLIYIDKTIVAGRRKCFQWRQEDPNVTSLSVSMKDISILTTNRCVSFNPCWIQCIVIPSTYCPITASWPQGINLKHLLSAPPEATHHVKQQLWYDWLTPNTNHSAQPGHKLNCKWWSLWTFACWSWSLLLTQFIDCAFVVTENNTVWIDGSKCWLCS